MDLITIGGATLPTPSSYNVTITDIIKSDRNAAGNMIIERITTKRVIQLGWNYLSNNDYSTILNTVTPVFFEVDFFDPQDNTIRTGTFYTGDRPAGMILFNNGIPSWSNVQFTITEK